MEENNILSEIELLEKNIPKNTTTLEKIRWIYIKLGQLISYDYRIVDKKWFQNEREISFKDDYIGRYQTCLEINKIVRKVLNNIEGVKCNIITRKLPQERGIFDKDHEANEVIFTDEQGYQMKLLLDLSLDLHLIQSGCPTMHFGFSDDGTGTYDIIPQTEDRKMDIKLGLVNENEETTEQKIEKAEEQLKKIYKSCNNPEEIIVKSLDIINHLFKNFYGYHEGKQYTNMLFRRLLKVYYKEFNIYYRKENEIYIKTIYKLELNGCIKWIVYSNKDGLIETNLDEIANILASGWQTNSQTLIEEINQSDKKSQDKNR